MSRHRRLAPPRPTSYVTRPMRTADWHARMERYRAGQPTLGVWPPPTFPPALPDVPTPPPDDVHHAEGQCGHAVPRDQHKDRR